MADVSNVTFDATPWRGCRLGVYAGEARATATVEDVVAWIRALPDAAASEFWSLTCDMPPHPWSWLAAAHAPTPADRLVEHVKAQPEEVRLAVLNGAFGGSLTAAIVADAEAEAGRQRQRAIEAERELAALRDQHFGDGVAIKRLEERVQELEGKLKCTVWMVYLGTTAKALREYADALVKREPGATDPIQLAHRKLAIFGFSAAMLEQAAAMIDVAAARLALVAPAEP